jgi:aldehyde dehydrogenase (NAD+)
MSLSNKAEQGSTSLARALRDLEGPETGVFIGGAWEAGEDPPFADIDPNTGRSFAQAPNASVGQVSHAIEAARDAADRGAWDHAGVDERARCLLQLADALERYTDDFAVLGATEAGICQNERLMQISGGAMAVRECAALAPAALADARGQRDGLPFDSVVVREPCGVVSVITPWNYPLTTNLIKLAPALVAGNTVVLKPSPLTPFMGLGLARLIDEETDIPPGVVNIVTTESLEAAELLATDPRIDMISFVGSAATGRRIMGAASGSLKRMLLELGGKSAAVVLDDADLDAVLPQLVTAACTLHAGQACILLSRVLVPTSSYDEVVERFADLVKDVRVGDPADAGSEMGPLISAEAQERVQRFVDRARDDGAEVATGGKPPTDLTDGFYFEPTVLANVDNGMQVAREEIFGPVTCMIPYESDDEAIRIANDSDYGLVSTVYTSSTDRGVGIARRIKAGVVAVGDAPMSGYFGGFKQSGIGREGGEIGVQTYTELKSMAVPS